MDDLLSAGHRVTGLARSMAKEEHLVAGGANVIQGSLDDIDILRKAAATADAVIHTAFNHGRVQGERGCGPSTDSPFGFGAGVSLVSRHGCLRSRDSTGASSSSGRRTGCLSGIRPLGGATIFLGMAVTPASNITTGSKD
ncbi:NAD(P)H-binding protein [Rhizobium sp. LjRoot258]|uniref:NAD(P)H-binding protein n=1 Tax=Rhizobium sp. LjRoot258 TaxID=3342299 RepID=UPI003F508D1A